MTINTTFDNCDFESAGLAVGGEESAVNLRVTFPAHIPTVQSKAVVKQQLIDLLHTEMAKFTWISFGPVWLELTWFINATDRQESDAIGDLDNITKPILDSLTGMQGILVDDTQIKSIYTRWLAKNSATKESILKISIRFINNDVLKKEKLHFVQYHTAMC